MHRAIEEHLAQGDEPDEAFDAAMLEETALGLPEEPSDEFEDGGAEEDWTEDADADEPWKESLPEAICEEEDGAEFDERPRHPLQEKTFDLMMQLHRLFKDETKPTCSHQDVLLHGAGEISGGLAQALGVRPRFASDETENLPFAEADGLFMSGLSVVQLKRALRGAAFALGALFPLKASGALDQAAFRELQATIDQLQTGIYAELTRLRQRRAGDT
jgi:hypothetical protein